MEEIHYGGVVEEYWEEGVQFRGRAQGAFNSFPEDFCEAVFFSFDNLTNSTFTDRFTLSTKYRCIRRNDFSATN